MSDTLLPCPFCGSDTAEEMYHDSTVPLCGKTSIRCVICECSTAFYRNPRHAHAAWNRRTIAKAKGEQT